MTADYKAKARELAECVRFDARFSAVQGVDEIASALLSADQAGAERMREEAAKLCEELGAGRKIFAQLAERIRGLGAKDAKPEGGSGA